MIPKLLWRIGLIKLVVLIDFDGDRTLCRMRPARNPCHVGSAYRMLYAPSMVGLRKDGTTAWVSYVKRWEWYDGTNDRGWLVDPEAEQAELKEIKQCSL